jgi:hypothetical protein
VLRWREPNSEHKEEKFTDYAKFTTRQAEIAARVVRGGGGVYNIYTSVIIAKPEVYVPAPEVRKGGTGSDQGDRRRRTREREERDED